MNRFTVISGGPGTGKTTTIVNIMALFLAMYPKTAPKIALAVPTGKAAARLQDAIREARDRLPVAEKIKVGLPGSAATIHRLLGTIPGSPYFRHHAGNRLDVDMVIIDESSMVDLALLSKVTMALPDHARLILVGDKDQLASVEAGSAFGDICDICRINAFSESVTRMILQTTGIKLRNMPAADNQSGIPNCMVQLTRNFRFAENSGIQKVSQAINSGNGKSALEYLQDPNYTDIAWEKIPDPRQLRPRLQKTVIKGFQPYLTAGSPVGCLGCCLHNSRSCVHCGKGLMVFLWSTDWSKRP